MTFLKGIKYKDKNVKKVHARYPTLPQITSGVEDWPAKQLQTWHSNSQILLIYKLMSADMLKSSRVKIIT